MKPSLRKLVKNVNVKIDEWKNSEAVKRNAETQDPGRRKSISANRGGGDKQFKQPSGVAPDKISREFTHRQAQDWVNEMNL